MAVLGQWDSGALPTTVGSGVSSEATSSWSGGPAIRFDQVASQSSQVRFEFASRQNVAIRAYLQMPASWASSAEALMIARSSSTVNVGQASIAGTGSPGQVRLLKADPSANAATSSNGTITNSTWYRFELLIDQTNGRGRLGVFPLQSDTAVWDSGWQTNDFGASAYRVEIGPAYTSPTMPTVRAANIMVTDDVSTWIGRTAGDNLPGPSVNILGQWDSGTLPTTVGSGVSYAASGGWGNRPAIQLDQASGQSSQVRFEFTAVTTVAVRAYIQLPAAWTASSQSLIIARFNSSTNVGQANIGGSGSPGQARLIKADPSATAAQSSTNTLSQSTWYRFELQLNQTAGQGRMAVFPLGSDTPLWNSGWAANDFGTSTYRVEIGPAYTSPTMGQVRVTNLMVTDSVSDWIGRVEGDDNVPEEPQTAWRILTASGWVEAFAHEVD